MLTQGKPFDPMLMVRADETAEIALDGLVHMPSLSGRLRMIRSTELQFSACRSKHRLPENAGEDRVTV